MARYLDSIDWSSVSCYNPSAESMWNEFMQIYGLPYTHMFLQPLAALTTLFTKYMANQRNHIDCEGVLLKSMEKAAALSS